MDSPPDIYTIKPRKSLIRITFLLMISRGLAFVLSFLREMIIAATFGVSKIVDAYSTAFAIPNVLYTLLTNVITTAFLPHFVTLSAQKGQAEANRSAQTLITHVLLILSVVAVSTAIFAPTLIQLLAPDFAPETTELAVRFLRVLIFGIISGAFFLFLQVLYQVQDQWVRPAITPIVANGIGVGILLMGVAWMGSYVLPWSWLIATLVLALMLLSGKAGKNFIRFTISNPNSKAFYFLAFPVALEGLFAGAVQIANRYLAVGVGEGELAAFSYAQRMYAMACDLVVASFIPALFPRLAESAAQQDKTEYQALIQKALLGTLLLTLGAVSILAGLSQPIVELLFERGVFTTQDTLKVSAIFFVFTGSLVFFLPLMVIYRSYHSIRKPIVPTTSVAFAVGITILISFLLIKSQQTKGLAIASMIGLGFQFIFMLSIGKRFGIVFPIKSVVKLMILGSIISGMIIFSLNKLNQSIRDVWQPEMVWGKIFILMGLMIVGSALFIGLAKLLRLPAIDEILSYLFAKVEKYRKKFNKHD